MSLEFDNKIKKLKSVYEKEDPTAVKLIGEFETRMAALVKKSAYARLEVTIEIRKELTRRIIEISKKLSLVRELKDETRDMLFAKREAYLETLRLFPEGDYAEGMTEIEKLIDHELEAI